MITSAFTSFDSDDDSAGIPTAIVQPTTKLSELANPLGETASACPDALHPYEAPASSQAGA